MTGPPSNRGPSAARAALGTKAVTWEPTPPQSLADQDAVLVVPTPSLSDNLAGPEDPESTSDSYLAAVMAGMTQAQTQKQAGQSRLAACNPPAASSLYHLVPNLDGWSQDISFDLPPSQSIGLGPETQKAADSMERNSIWTHQDSEDSLILPTDPKPVFPAHSMPHSPPGKSSHGRSPEHLPDQDGLSKENQRQNPPNDATPDDQGSSPVEMSIDHGLTEQPSNRSCLQRNDILLDQSQDTSSLDAEPSLPQHAHKPSRFLSPLPKRPPGHPDGGPMQSTCPNDDFPSPYPDVTVELFKQPARLAAHPNAVVPDAPPLDSLPSVQENSLSQSGHGPEQQNLSPPALPRLKAHPSKSADHEMPDGRPKLPSNSSRSPTSSRDLSQASTDTSDRLRPRTQQARSTPTAVIPIPDLSGPRLRETGASLPPNDNIPLTESLQVFTSLPATQIADSESLAVESDPAPRQASGTLGTSATTQAPNQPLRSALVPETPDQVPSALTRLQSPSECVGCSSRDGPLTSASTTASLVSEDPLRCRLAVKRTLVQEAQQASGGPVQMFVPAFEPTKVTGRVLAPETPAQVPSNASHPGSPSERIGRQSRRGPLASAVASPPLVSGDPGGLLAVGLTAAQGFQQQSGCQEASGPAQKPISKSTRPVLAPETPAQVPSNSSHPQSPSEQASAEPVAGAIRVAVVIPQRKQKALARRDPGFSRFPCKANALTHVPPSTTSYRPGGPFPVQRVLAYNSDSRSFSPGQVYSVTPNQVVVKFDDGMVQAHELAKLRRCEIRVGDLVRYIGTDLADQESQFTDVREPKRVLSVEMGSEDRSAGCHLRADVVVCCNEEDYQGMVGGSGMGENSFGKLSRFLVEAIQVLPDCPQKHHGLSDRLLVEEVNKSFQELMKAQSGVGKRVKTAARRAQLTSAAVAISSPEQFFQGFGILVTSAATSEPRAPGRKKTASFREMIERQIRERHGTVIDKVTELYELTSAEDVPDIAAPTKGKQRARFDDDYEACQLRPAPKHQELRQIILVADSSTKTFKYLMSLALGIPCVSTRWVTDSYAQGSALDWEKYMIGPGPSAFLGGAQALNNLQSRLVDRTGHDLAAIFNWRQSLKIFSDKTFIYVSSKAKNKSDWAEIIRPILCAAGATRVAFVELKDLQQSPDKQQKTKQFHYVLLEDHLQPDLLLEGPSSKRRKVAGGNKLKVENKSKTERIVDWEWVKQCLIYGSVLWPELFAPQVSCIRPFQKR